MLYVKLGKQDKLKLIKMLFTMLVQKRDKLNEAIKILISNNMFMEIM